MKLDPHDLWPFYQILVGIGTLVIAIEGAIIAHALVKISNTVLPGMIIRLPRGELQNEIRLPINDEGVTFKDDPR